MLCIPLRLGQENGRYNPRLSCLDKEETQSWEHMYLLMLYLSLQLGVDFGEHQACDKALQSLFEPTRRHKQNSSQVENAPTSLSIPTHQRSEVTIPTLSAGSVKNYWDIFAHELLWNCAVLLLKYKGNELTHVGVWCKREAGLLKQLPEVFESTQWRSTLQICTDHLYSKNPRGCWQCFAIRVILIIELCQCLCNVFLIHGDLCLLFFVGFVFLARYVSVQVRPFLEKRPLYKIGKKGHCLLRPLESLL